MNSEPTDYEGGLMNCRFRNNGREVPGVGETHGLPYLATLYRAQGH